VEAHQGFLIEIRGDEALVAFVSARQALRAAVELQGRFGQSGLPRGIGIGLDSGEAIPVGEGYRGGALNLAARLCSQAKSGEILASEAVIHLAAKVDGVAYVDPRTFKLKGYAEPVRAVAVVTSDRASTYTLRRRLAHRTRRVAARRGFQVAVAGVLIAGLLALLLPRVLGGGGGSPFADLDPGMALLDAKTGNQLGFIPLSVVKTPVEAIYSDGHFWVLNLDPLSFVEIDPKTGAVLTQIASPVPNIGYYGVQGDDLWITDYDNPTLVKVNIALRREVDRFPFSDDPEHFCPFGGCIGGVLAAEGSVWVDAGPDVLRLDPETGEVQHQYEGQYGHAIAFSDGSIWNLGSEQGSGLTRIDPKTDSVVASANIEGNLNYISAGGGFGWTADETKGVVYKVDGRGNLVATYPTGEGARVVSFADGVLWVGNQDVGSASGIDSVTGKETIYQFEHPIQAVAAGSGSLLVQLNPGRTYEDRIDSLQGKVAKFLVAAYQLDGDPATSFGSLDFEVEFATCANLFNYPDQPSPEGWNLQPEVAASMPEVSDDGRTYTFTIRPGYMFSPPSNQEVTAETFRHSIERALSPKLSPGGRTPGSNYIEDIDGETGFLGGSADHISGLRAQGNTLTITLTRPSPDLLERLTLPFFCPVPTDVPMVPHGAVLQNEGGGGMVPSAGPYYIADAFNGEFAILKRNPNYPGSRPHVLDAIALREGVDPGQAVERVQSGAWDGITNLGDPILDLDGQVANTYGPGGTATPGTGPEYYSVPDGGLLYLDINAGRPLFSDRRVREAVAYALDRPALARIFGNAVPTDQLLPPNQAGAQTAGFPLDGPDLAKARELMHGTTGTAVLVTHPSGVVQPFAEEIKAELALIGIDVRIKTVDSSFDAIHEPGAPYDLKVGGNSLDPLDSTVYLQSMLGAVPLSRLLLLPAVLPPDWKSPAMRALAAQLRDIPSEAAALELLHGPITREVPMTGIAYNVAGAFLSPRLGCRVFPPASFGVDFAALCLGA